MADKTRKIRLQVVDEFSSPLHSYQRQVGQAVTATQRLGNAGTSSSGGFRQLTQDVYFGINAAKAAVGAFSEVAQQVEQLRQQGAKSLKMGEAFENYAGGAEKAAKWTDAIQEAVNGTLTKMQAQEIALSEMSLGLASSTEEAEKFTRILAIVGEASPNLGGMSDAISQVSLMLSNMSYMRLDQFGLSAGRVRARVNELKDDAEALGKTLSDEDAFKTAVMEGLEERANRLGDSILDVDDATQRLKNRWSELKMAAAEKITLRIELIAEGVEEFIADVQNGIKEAQNDPTIWNLPQRMIAEAPGVIDTTAGVVDYALNPGNEQRQSDFNKALEEANSLLDQARILALHAVGEPATNEERYRQRTDYSAMASPNGGFAWFANGAPVAGDTEAARLGQHQGEDYWESYYAAWDDTRENALERSNQYWASQASYGEAMAGYYDDRARMQAVHGAGDMFGGYRDLMGLGAQPDYVSAYMGASPAVQGAGGFEGQSDVTGDWMRSADAVGEYSEALDRANEAQQELIDKAAEEAAVIDNLAEKFGLLQTSFDADVASSWANALGTVELEQTKLNDAQQIYSVLTGGANAQSILFDEILQRTAEDLATNAINAEEAARQVQAFSTMDYSGLEILDQSLREGTISWESYAGVIERISSLGSGATTALNMEEAMGAMMGDWAGGDAGATEGDKPRHKGPFDTVIGQFDEIETKFGGLEERFNLATVQFEAFGQEAAAGVDPATAALAELADQIVRLQGKVIIDISTNMSYGQYYSRQAETGGGSDPAIRPAGGGNTNVALNIDGKTVAEATVNHMTTDNRGNVTTRGGRGT